MRKRIRSLLCLGLSLFLFTESFGGAIIKAHEPELKGSTEYNEIRDYKKRTDSIVDNTKTNTTNEGVKNQSRVVNRPEGPNIYSGESKSKSVEVGRPGIESNKEIRKMTGQGDNVLSGNRPENASPQLGDLSDTDLDVMFDNLKKGGPPKKKYCEVFSINNMARTAYWRPRKEDLPDLESWVKYQGSKNPKYAVVNTDPFNLSNFNQDPTKVEVDPNMSAGSVTINTPTPGYEGPELGKVLEPKTYDAHFNNIEKDSRLTQKEKRAIDELGYDILLRDEHISFYGSGNKTVYNPFDETDIDESGEKLKIDYSPISNSISDSGIYNEKKVEKPRKGDTTGETSDFESSGEGTRWTLYNIEIGTSYYSKGDPKKDELKDLAKKQIENGAKYFHRGFVYVGEDGELEKEPRDGSEIYIKRADVLPVLYKSLGQYEYLYGIKSRVNKNLSSSNTDMENGLVKEGTDESGKKVPVKTYVELFITRSNLNKYLAKAVEDDVLSDLLIIDLPRFVYQHEEGNTEVFGKDLSKLGYIINSQQKRTHSYDWSIKPGNDRYESNKDKYSKSEQMSYMSQESLIALNSLVMSPSKQIMSENGKVKWGRQEPITNKTKNTYIYEFRDQDNLYGYFGRVGNPEDRIEDNFRIVSDSKNAVPYNIKDQMVTYRTLFKIVRKLMERYGEPTITSREEEILLKTYGWKVPGGLTRGTPEYKDYAYLLVRGILDDEMDYEIDDYVTRENLLVIASRVSNKELRATFKLVDPSIQLDPALDSIGAFGYTPRISKMSYDVVELNTSEKPDPRFSISNPNFNSSTIDEFEILEDEITEVVDNEISTGNDIVTTGDTEEKEKEKALKTVSNVAGVYSVNKLPEKKIKKDTPKKLQFTQTLNTIYFEPKGEYTLIELRESVPVGKKKYKYILVRNSDVRDTLNTNKANSIGIAEITVDIEIDNLEPRFEYKGSKVLSYIKPMNTKSAFGIIDNGLFTNVASTVFTAKSVHHFAPPKNEGKNTKKVSKENALVASTTTGKSNFENFYNTYLDNLVLDINKNVNVNLTSLGPLSNLGLPITKWKEADEVKHNDLVFGEKSEGSPFTLKSLVYKKIAKSSSSNLQSFYIKVGSKENLEKLLEVFGAIKFANKNHGVLLGKMRSESNSQDQVKEIIKKGAIKFDISNSEKLAETIKGKDPSLSGLVSKDTKVIKLVELNIKSGSDEQINNSFSVPYYSSIGHSAKVAVLQDGDSDNYFINFIFSTEELAKKAGFLADVREQTITEQLAAGATPEDLGVNVETKVTRDTKGNVNQSTVVTDKYSGTILNNPLSDYVVRGTHGENPYVYVNLGTLINLGLIQLSQEPTSNNGKTLILSTKYGMVVLDNETGIIYNGSSVFKLAKDTNGKPCPTWLIGDTSSGETSIKIGSTGTLSGASKVNEKVFGELVWINLAAVYGPVGQYYDCSDSQTIDGCKVKLPSNESTKVSYVDGNSACKIVTTNTDEPTQIPMVTVDMTKILGKSINSKDGKRGIVLNGTNPFADYVTWYDDSKGDWGVFKFTPKGTSKSKRVSEGIEHYQDLTELVVPEETKREYDIIKIASASNQRNSKTDKIKKDVENALTKNDKTAFVYVTGFGLVYIPKSIDKAKYDVRKPVEAVESQLLGMWFDDYRNKAKSSGDLGYYVIPNNNGQGTLTYVNLPYFPNLKSRIAITKYEKEEKEEGKNKYKVHIRVYGIDDKKKKFEKKKNKTYEMDDTGPFTNVIQNTVSGMGAYLMLIPESAFDSTQFEVIKMSNRDSKNGRLTQFLQSGLTQKTKVEGKYACLNGFVFDITESGAAGSNVILNLNTDKKEKGIKLKVPLEIQFKGSSVFKVVTASHGAGSKIYLMILSTKERLNIFGDNSEFRELTQDIGTQGDFKVTSDIFNFIKSWKLKDALTMLDVFVSLAIYFVMSVFPILLFIAVTLLFLTSIWSDNKIFHLFCDKFFDPIKLLSLGIHDHNTWNLREAWFLLIVPIVVLAIFGANYLRILELFAGNLGKAAEILRNGFL